MKPIQLISPVDGSVYAERLPLTQDAAIAAAKRAKAAQKAWAARSLEDRIALVKAGVAKLNEMKDRVVEELAWQMGRPTRFGGEFGGVNARTDYMSEIAAEVLAPKIVEDSDKFRRYLAREALGVVFIVAPWNYPYLTTINTLVPALIAGNTVVLKHASQTMLVGERLAEAFHAAGVPEDVFQNVVLDHATTEHLIAGRYFNFVNFTGSVAGGAAMERAAAGTFTPLGLELGGKDQHQRHHRLNAHAGRKDAAAMKSVNRVPCRQHQNQGGDKLKQAHQPKIPGTGGDVIHVPGHRHHQHLVGAHAGESGEPKAHELTVGKQAADATFGHGLA